MVNSLAAKFGGSRAASLFSLWQFINDARKAITLREGTP